MSTEQPKQPAPRDPEIRELRQVAIKLRRTAWLVSALAVKDRDRARQLLASLGADLVGEFAPPPAPPAGERSAEVVTK